MSVSEDRLEILIGKLLDGEISPAQQRILDRELEQDGRARELLEQSRVLHECGCEIVHREVRLGGADPQEVFERAWRQNRGSLWRRVVRVEGRLRFPIGLAAGFILGLALHLVLFEGSKPPMIVTANPPTVERTPPDQGGSGEVWPVIGRPDSRQATREVEWYGFTDQAGNQWLVEGFREGVVRPASYHGGL